MDDLLHVFEPLELFPWFEWNNFSNAYVVACNCTDELMNCSHLRMTKCGLLLFSLKSCLALITSSPDAWRKISFTFFCLTFSFNTAITLISGFCSSYISALLITFVRLNRRPFHHCLKTFNISMDTTLKHHLLSSFGTKQAERFLK